MSRSVATGLYLVLLVAVIAVVDVLFFRDYFWERLAANVGIVLVFGAFYFGFMNGPEWTAWSRWSKPERSSHSATAHEPEK